MLVLVLPLLWPGAWPPGAEGSVQLPEVLGMLEELLAPGLGRLPVPGAVGTLGS